MMHTPGWHDLLHRGFLVPLLQDKKKIEQKMKRDYPPLKNATKLEWGFKIRLALLACCLEAWVYGYIATACPVQCLDYGP